MKLGFVFSIATALIGDFSGKYLAEYQPEKLAAAEWHFETQENAPLILFGVLSDGEIKYALEIPFGLSMLAHNNPKSEVIGLDRFPEDEIPPLYIHYLFNIMVFIGMWMTILSALYWIGINRGWRRVSLRWFRWLIVLGAPLSFIAIEAGWWLAEVGRQPWILRRLMRVEDAATTSGQVDLMLMLFSALYLILGIGTIVVLRRMFLKNPVERELADRHMEKGGDVQ